MSSTASMAKRSFLLSRSMALSPPGRKRRRSFRRLALEEGGDALHQALGDVALRQRRPILDARLVDEVDGVGIAAEGAGRRRHVVGEDPVAALAGALRLGVLDHLLGLRSEADDEARAAIAGLAQAGEDVGVLDELEGGRRAVLLLELAAPPRRASRQRR